MKFRPGHLLAYLVLSALAVLLMVPMIWMTLCAFTPQLELQREVPMGRTFGALGIETLSNPEKFGEWIDDYFTTRNFRDPGGRGGLFDLTAMPHSEFREAPVHRWIPMIPASPERTDDAAPEAPVSAGRYTLWFENTLLVAATVTLLSVLFNAMSGYAFAKIVFPGRRLMFMAIIATLMIPGQVTVIPLFFLFTHGLGWHDSFWAVILPQLAAPLGIFLMRQYIQTLPSQLEDAARIDGCSEPGVFARVILPLSKPILATWAIFTFIGAWKAFLWPLIILDDQNMYMLEVGLKTLQFSAGPRNIGIVMSASLLASIPMILIFFAFQKYLMRGLTAGAVKG